MDEYLHALDIAQPPPTAKALNAIKQSILHINVADRETHTKKQLKSKIIWGALICSFVLSAIVAGYYADLTLFDAAAIILLVIFFIFLVFTLTVSRGQLGPPSAEDVEESFRRPVPSWCLDTLQACIEADPKIADYVHAVMEQGRALTMFEFECIKRFQRINSDIAAWNAFRETHTATQNETVSN